MAETFFFFYGSVKYIGNTWYILPIGFYLKKSRFFSGPNYSSVYYWLPENPQQARTPWYLLDVTLIHVIVIDILPRSVKTCMLFSTITLFSFITYHKNIGLEKYCLYIWVPDMIQCHYLSQNSRTISFYVPNKKLLSIFDENSTSCYLKLRFILFLFFEVQKERKKWMCFF